MKRLLVLLGLLTVVSAAAAKYGIDEAAGEGSGQASSGAMWFVACAALIAWIVVLHGTASRRFRDLEQQCAALDAKLAQAQTALQVAATDHTVRQLRHEALRSLVQDYLDGLTTTDEFFKAADSQLHPKFAFDPSAALAYVQQVQNAGDRAGRGVNGVG